MMSEDISRGIEWIIKGQEALQLENQKQAENIQQLLSQIEALNTTVNHLQTQNKTLTTKYTNVLKTTKQLIQFRNVIKSLLIILITKSLF